VSYWCPIGVLLVSYWCPIGVLLVYSTCDKMQTFIAQSYTRPVINLIYTHMILVHDLPGQHMHHPMCNFHARASHILKRLGDSEEGIVRAAS
jgi:fumarate reductase subunit D